MRQETTTEAVVAFLGLLALCAIGWLVVIIWG